MKAHEQSPLANSCKLTKLASISTHCIFYPNTVGLTSDSKKVPKTTAAVIFLNSGF